MVEPRPKLVNGDQEKLPKVVIFRSQEFHDSTEALTSVISGDKMRVELEKNRIRKITPKLFRPGIHGPKPIGPGPD